MMPDSLRGAGDQLAREWDALIQVIQGKPSPLAKQPQSSPSEAPEIKRDRENAEILQEMLKVVWNRQSVESPHFRATVDSMNQGASIEGHYHGITLSSEYRDAESRTGVAPSGALRVFVEEIQWLQKGVSKPSRFDDRSALPPAAPVQPTEADAAVPDSAIPKELVFDSGRKVSPTPSQGSEIAQSAAEIEKIFSRSSIYTLKRVLGAEAVRLVNERASDRNALASWYGPWASRMASKGIDFGLQLRNRPDPVFHSQWAQTVSVDQVLWEILNRLHRTINVQAPARASVLVSPSPSPAPQSFR